MSAFLSDFFSGFWLTLTAMSPYLLFGFLVAGFLSVLVPPSLVERHLGGRGLWPVLKASFFGVPLPLCSCGVIPVAASLRRHGASRGAVTAFLLSTPQTGIDSIMVTYGLLGPVVAVFRPIAAFVAGILGGAAVSASGADKGIETEDEPRCEGACCIREPHRGRFAAALHYGFVTLPADIGPALVLGLVLAGVISAAVPGDFFAKYLPAGILGMLVMLAFGIPVYVCATASVPIAAALIAKGVSPGAALVFLMTGPATNAATIATVWKVMGRRTALIYFGSVAVTSLASGMIFDALFTAEGAAAHFHEAHEGGGMLPGAAVALMAVLLYSAWRERAKRAKPIAEKTDLTFHVTGMHCSHCVESVKRALREVRGVTSVEVDLGEGLAIVRGEGLDRQALADAIRNLGYGVSGES
jgi:uncharacterized membrane protein YraQ (UPF0718 family)/copper chaperone CopZ